MQTRSHSNSTSVNSSEITACNYNTRLGNRIMNITTTIDFGPTTLMSRAVNYNVTPSNSKGPAYNTRIAHNVLSPRSYCVSREIKKEVVPPTKHKYNTRYSANYGKPYEVDIDFDGASSEWNSNKRRVGQMYEYI